MSEKELSVGSRAESAGGQQAALLLSWYRRHRRDLPWRRTRDPYAIWVSEVMLQQTQVSKVEPFFEAFMDRFPSIESLAEASIDQVLAVWTGLGYYRRARFLHRAAGELIEQGRAMPRTAAELQDLPGIGAYTAAAVASIAFDELVPVLDGNVERVICRLLALAEDPKRGHVRKSLLEEAEKLLDRRSPGESNQALMELGATVCRPHQPKCLICPLSEFCRGRQSPESYPAARKRRASELVTIHVALVRRDHQRLFFKRPKSAELMAGLWELPNVEEKTAEAGEPLELPRVEEKLGQRYGGRWQLEPAITSVRHGITYRSITAFMHAARVETPASVAFGPEVASGPEAAWIGDADFQDFAMSSLVAKVLDAASGRA